MARVGVGVGVVGLVAVGDCVFPRPVEDTSNSSQNLEVGS